MPWIEVKKPITIQQKEKEKIQQIVADALKKTNTLKVGISRITIRSGRVYLYKWCDPAASEEFEFIQPPLNRKDLEYLLLRISIYNRNCTNCSLDFQRHTGQWMTVNQGTLEECIAHAEASGLFDWN
jgi:hypothetical protein